MAYLTRLTLWGAGLALCLLMPVRAQPTDDTCPAPEVVPPLPVFDSARYCLSLLVHQPEGGEMAFTALTFDPAGTLYATRPHAGEVWAIRDGTPPQRLITGLTLPNALTFHEGALYIAGGAHIYRWRDEALTTLVDDLPFSGGLWTGGIAISDGRLIVGASASHHTPGALLSYTLEGDDRRVIAEGLRQVAGLAWHDGSLWLTDIAHPGADGRPDRLYRLALADDAPDLTPVIDLPLDSTPSALAYYDPSHTALPDLRGKWLIVLNGSHPTVRLTGYAVAALTLSDDGTVARWEYLLPYLDDRGDNHNANRSAQFGGRGFHPHRPYGIAISPQGWIAISAGGGRVYRLATRD